MKNTSFQRKILTSMIAAALTTGVAGSTLANDISLVSNQFTISNNDDDNALSVTATLGSDGVLITTGATLPTLAVTSDTLNSGLPTFSFDIADGLEAGTHSFKVGLSISDDASPTTRRFEAYIGTLTLTVDGSGDVTGSIPSQSMLVRAKKGSATFYEAISNPSENGGFSVSGPRLTFSGSDAVERLQAQGSAALDGVLADFALNGVFTFQVVVEETTSTGARIGVTSGASFTAVPRLSVSCSLDSASTVDNVFQLLSRTETGFSNPYAVQGRFATGTGDTTLSIPTAFTETCTASAGGGGGGGAVSVVDDVESAESAVDDLDDVLDSIDSAGGTLDETALEQVDNLNDALATLAEQLDTQADEEIASGVVSDSTVTSSTSVATKSATATTAIANSLASGATVSKASVLGALTSGAKSSATASKVGKATTSAASKTALVTQNKTILTNSATMLASLASNNTELTVEEVAEVRTVATNLVSTSNSLAQSGTSTSDLKDIATQTATVLQAQADLGIAADTALVDAVSTASEAMAAAVFTQELTLDGVAPTTEQITEALTTNTTLFDSVLEASIPLPPAVIITKAETSDRIALARPTITEAVKQAMVNATAKVVRPNNIVLKSGKTALATLLDALRSATVSSSLTLNPRIRDAVALTTETEITTDETTGLVTISSADETYVGMVVGVRSVPAAVPSGIRSRSDGRATVVTEGTAIDIAPNAFSLLDFVDVAETAGFSFTQNTNASFTLGLGEGQTFVGTFAYDNLVDADLSASCGALGVIGPVGEFNAPSYSFGIECASGVLQRVVPFTANTAFFDSVKASEMTVSVDRNTGVITVSGYGKLKPSFFTAQPTEVELAYHATETDSFGIALQLLDINSDGITDYKVISATSVQIMYGLN
jgi:hypothetical protein